MAYYFVSIVIAGDGMFGYYALHLIGELGLLRQEYQNLKFTDNYKKDLKACLRRHKLIQDSLPVLEKIYQVLSLWLCITCATVI